jgi:hypothetical protein
LKKPRRTSIGEDIHSGSITAPGDARVAILIPVYKPELSPLEQFSIDYSLSVIKDRKCFFIAPAGLDCSYYSNRYPRVEFEFFPREYFDSIDSYSRLLLAPFFYDRFLSFEFVLILQPDAILIRDDLDFWIGQPFDYIGAPWPDGVELTVWRDRFRDDLRRRVRATVGNGGLSLRRVRKCLALIHEFPETRTVFMESGTNEDSYFSLLGALSIDFIIPNEIIASRFSMELRPEYFHAVNGGYYPMGVHAWWTVQPKFWAPCIPPLAAVL